MTTAPLGPRPFRSVLLPSLLATGLLGVWLVRSPRGVGWDPGIPAALAVALVAAVTLLAVGERRHDLVPWIAGAATVLVVADVWTRSGSAVAVSLAGSAVCWFLALRAEVDDRPWSGSVALVAAAGASAAAVLLMVAQFEVLAGIPVGFALVVAALDATIDRVREVVPGAATGLVLSLGALVGAIAFGYSLDMDATVPIVAGGLAACGALAMLAGTRAWRVLGLGTVVGAVVVVAQPGARALALALVTATVCWTGLAEPALGALRRRLGDRWLRGAPLVGWLLGAAGAAFVAAQLAGSGDSGLRAVEVDDPRLAVGVLVATVVALAPPWPTRVVATAGLPGAVRRLESALGALWRGVVRAADAGDRSVMATGRAVARLGAPLWGPTRPADTGFDADVSVRRRLLDLLVPAGMWLAMCTLVTNVAVAASLAGGRWAWPTRLVWPFDLDPTGRLGWGTGDYWAIADHGYRLGEHREAFLPLLPLLMRGLHQVTGLPLTRAGVLISAVSGLAAALLLWAWMRHRRVPRATRVLATALFLVFPWNFLLFGYGYADATVVALVLGALLLAELERPVLAGLVGAAAAVTRPNGIPIVLVLLLFELVRSGALRRPVGDEGWGPRRLPHGRFVLDLRRMGIARWGVLLSASGLVAFSVWMGRHSGDPFLWFTQEKYYGHEPITQLAAWIESIFGPWPSVSVTGWREGVNQLATAVVVLGSLLMLPAVRRRFGAAYGFLCAVTWMVAWTGSRVFTPSARLIMPITPFLAVVAAAWLVRRPRLAAPVLVGSVAGGLTLVMLFTRGGSLWVGW